jgi:hypothetical protein
MQVVFDLIRTLVAPAAQVLAALLGAYFLALWVTLIIWTFRDIETRSRSVITQIFSTLLVVFFFLPGVLLYMILRPRETLDEAFQRALQEEYLLQDLEELPLCPTCRHYVQSDFVLCPHCQARLRENCPHCERLVELRWSVCPYCAVALPTSDEGEVETEAEALAPPRLPNWVSPAVHRLRARVMALRAREVEQASAVEEYRPPSLPAMTEAPPPPPSTGNGYHEAEKDTVLSPEPSGRSRTRLDPLADGDLLPDESLDGALPVGEAPADEAVAPEVAGTGRRRRK